MRDGRLAPSASSTVTLTVAPRSTGCVSRTTPSAPSKRPAGNCLAEPGRLTHAWYARPSTARPRPSDQQDCLIAVPDDEHEPSGGGRERHPDRPGACEHGHAALERRLASRNAGAGRAGASSDECPRAEADRGQTGSDGEGGERRPARPRSRRKRHGCKGDRGGTRRVVAGGSMRGSAHGWGSSCIRPRISGAPDDTRGRPGTLLPPTARAGDATARACCRVPAHVAQPLRRSGGNDKSSHPVESESFTSMIGARKPARRMLQIGTSR